MILRRLSSLVLLGALLLSSGCCWHRHHCCHHPLLFPRLRGCCSCEHDCCESGCAACSTCSHCGDFVAGPPMVSPEPAIASLPMPRQVPLKPTN